jgi:hypothetical protein
MFTRTMFVVSLLFIAGQAMAQGQPKKVEAKKAESKKAEVRKVEVKKEEVKKDAVKEEAKDLSGMSIVGTNETPKALIIIPWKSSEIGQEAGFNSSLLKQEIGPVDKPTFLRELEFFKLSNPDSPPSP